VNAGDCTEYWLGVGWVSGRPQGTGQDYLRVGTLKVTRSDGRSEFLGTSTWKWADLSSAAAGRLHRADAMTSNFVGFGARTAVGLMGADDVEEMKVAFNHGAHAIVDDFAVSAPLRG
jgi:hypothetical protein